MNDQNLLEKTDRLIESERELLSKILESFREIDRRRLYSSLGYKSLFEMLIRRYGYSEDEAYRRISAMRLLKEVPEMKGRLDAGEITLTHLSIAQSYFRREKKLNVEFQKEEKIALIEELAGKSVRKAQQMTRTLSSQPQIRPDTIIDLTDEFVEFRFVGTRELREKIDHLKALLAHEHPAITLSELFEKLCDVGLKEGKGRKSVAPQKHRVIKSKTEIRRSVFAKAKNRCQKCGSNYALQIDHILPKAKGGTDLEENLRVLCRSCNQRAAIEDFGLRKMDRFLN